MNAGKVIGYIFSAILVFFGVLFIWGAFGQEGNPAWIIIGGITVLIGFVIIYFLGRKKPGDQQVQYNTTLKVDLPGDVNVERFKCADCGAQLSMDNVKMVAGAPMVDCPYCGAAYQLTEEPKW
jgi:predicted RNA-binding Zn-ribbon protein involved in translation (DUF1610 family)